MKFQKKYLIEGILTNEFYEKNATDLDFYLNGDYHLMSSEKDSNKCNEQNVKELDSLDNGNLDDLPF